MKAVILAAGRGSRLAPLTDEVPKCLVKYRGKEILAYELEAMRECGIHDIGIVGGYRFDVLKAFVNERYGRDFNFSFFYNENHASTNMVHTLFCASDFLDDEILISYSDIIYSSRILWSLLQASSDMAVVVDSEWRELWEKRFNDPLSDAETLKVRDGRIKELGKRASRFDEIQGQYIGLVKVSNGFIETFKRHYDSLDRWAIYDGKGFENIYMTSFIQSIIDRFDNVAPVWIRGGWGEIDSPSDLEVEIGF